MEMVINKLCSFPPE